MSLTSRDKEEIQYKEIKEPPFSRFLIGLIRLLARIPAVDKYISGTVGGLNGSYIRSYNDKNYEESSKISIYALERFRNKKSKILPSMDHHHWWSFMKDGVDSARMNKKEEVWKKLIQLANTGVEPYEGYDVAYSYLHFSSWKFKAKNYEDAIKYAKISSEADKTWADPEFQLGWYGLLLSKGNAEEHLANAIERDKRIFFRIANNEVCKQYPHIVKKLKEKYSLINETAESN